MVILFPFSFFVGRIVYSVLGNKLVEVLANFVGFSGSKLFCVYFLLYIVSCY